MDPVLLLEELADLGQCSFTGQTEDIPNLKDIDPELCYLSWDIVITTNKVIEAIIDVFIFVEDGSDRTAVSDRAQHLVVRRLLDGLPGCLSRFRTPTGSARKDIPRRPGRRNDR